MLTTSSSLNYCGSALEFAIGRTMSGFLPVVIMSALLAATSFAIGVLPLAFVFSSEFSALRDISGC
ncbi:hypothetical protein BKA93DRAFT_813664 [Sparassis latifolia]